MHAQDPVSLFFDDELDKTFRVQVRLCPRVRQEWEFANLVLDSSSLELLLVLSDPCNLRVGVNDRWDDTIVDVTMAGLDVFGRGNTLFLSFVSKHGAEGNVTDTSDALDSGIKLVVDDNATPVIELDANILEVKSLGIWSATNSDENDICVELCCAIFILD